MSGAYADERDRPALLNLLRAGRVAAAMDRYPTRFRLELLLSSRLHAPLRDARLWTDALDAPLGFAALLSRAPEGTSASPILLVHPRVADTGLEVELLAWCEASAVGRAAERGAAISLDVGACEDEVAKRDLLIRHGFVARADVQNVYLVRSLHLPLPTPVLAASYQVRPLVGADELDAYETLYSFAPMRRSHRRALLRNPD